MGTHELDLVSGTKLELSFCFYYTDRIDISLPHFSLQVLFLPIIPITYGIRTEAAERLNKEWFCIYYMYYQDLSILAS